LSTQEDASNNEADKVRWKHGFTFRSRRQTAKKEEHTEDELHFRLADTRGAETRDDILRPGGHEPQHNRHDHDEHNQPDIEVGKQSAESEHGTEVCDETRGENHSPQRRIAQASLDHYSVNDRHRRRGKSDAGDLRLPQ
jgi:hypothetical protein